MLNRRSITLLLLVGLGLLLVSCSITRVKWRIKTDKALAEGRAEYLDAPVPSAKRKRPPNIIVLLADDLGKYEVSAYGAEHIATPNIDQIGAEGVVFEEGYVTAPTCAPSRAGIMSGRIQNRYGFETQIMEHYPTNWVEYISGRWFVDTGEFVVKARPSFPSEWQAHKQGLPSTEITLAEMLKKYGYATGLVGKWHLGVSRKQVPLERGFDYQFGFNGAFSLYTPERNWPHVINHEHKSFSAQHQWNMGRREEAAILLNGEVVREEQYLTYAFRDRMKEYSPKSAEIVKLGPAISGAQDQLVLAIANRPDVIGTPEESLVRQVAFLPGQVHIPSRPRTSSRLRSRSRAACFRLIGSTTAST